MRQIAGAFAEYEKARLERRSLRKISRELAGLGYLNEQGRPFSAKSIRSMLG